MYQTVINAIRKPFGLFGGGFNAADLQEQQSACEGYFKYLEGQMAEIQDSFAYRMVSWLLPKRNDNSEGGIGDVPVIQRLLSSLPVVGGFWKSPQDLQWCQLQVQTMERKLDTLKNDLKSIGILGKFFPDFVIGTEGGAIAPQIWGGNWFRVGVVSSIVAGSIVLWKCLATNEEEKELKDLGKNVQLEMEKQIEFLDSELEHAWEEIISRCQKESKDEEEKKELKAEIQRLFNTLEILQKDKKIETENFLTKMQDLQLTNVQLQSELSNKEIKIEDDLNELAEKDKQILGLMEQLENVRQENEARMKRESKLEEEIEELKVENLGLSNRNKTLHKEKEIEIEKFSIQLQDLQKTNDQLKEKLSNKDTLIGQYLNRFSEMEEINLEMTEKLTRVEDEKMSCIHWLHCVIKEKIEKLEEMKTQKERLEKSLSEARLNDLVRNGKYNCLLEEVNGLKEENSNKVNDLKDTKKEACRTKYELSKALEEMCELKESMASIAKERDSLKEHICHLNSSERLAEDRIVQITKENVVLKDKLLAENEARMKSESKLEEEIEELKVENLGLSNRNKTLHKEKEIEIEKFSIQLQDLQKTNDQLKEKLSNKDTLIGQYLNRFSEMEEINLEMTEKLTRVEDEKMSCIHWLHCVIKEKIEKLEEMKTQKERLEKSLSEARLNDLVRNGRYNCLLEEVKGLKEENSNKVNDLKDTKKEACRTKYELSKALEEMCELKESMASIAKERDSLKEHICHLNSSERLAEDRIVQITRENVVLKDKLLAENEITSSLKEELERRDKKKENRPTTRKVRLNRPSLEISNEMDVKKDEQKEDVQRNGVNKAENKVVKATEDVDANGHKDEKEVVGGPTGVGQLLSWLLASKGALPDDDHQEKQKVQKEIYLGEEEEQQEEEEKEEEEQQEEEQEKEEEKKIVEKKTSRKTIVFDLEPDQPKRVFSSYITFQGEKVGAETTRDNNLKGHVSVHLDVPRKFHRAIYGVEGRTLKEITRQSGVSSIDMPRRHECSNLITISGSIGQVQVAADHIQWLLRSLTGN
ncbi:putative autophagy-related protein 11 [Palaemon carinicauda]|uniref:putative autophagy-related protein 11 n=1 Tax=Palaemon carinicauda TaxID=392227 RepID=UPI0035B5D7BA